MLSIRKNKPKLPRTGTNRREMPQGPSLVICSVIENATGRTVTEAAGRASPKKSASDMAKKNALRRLKKALGRRVNYQEYTFLAQN